MDKKQLMKVWEAFAEKSDFKLNPDKAHVDMVADGVLGNEKETGLKLCPCRLRDGTFETDMGLLCPCNFKAQDVWRAQGRCWCGLFVRK